MKRRPAQRSLFAEYSPPPRARRDGPVQVLTVDQPHATLLAVGEQWLYVSPLKLGGNIEIAIRARWPAPRQMKHFCERYRDRLLARGVRRYTELPNGAIVATGVILSRKRVPARTVDADFWKAVEPQLDLVPTIDRGDFAYRLKLEAIRPVPCEVNLSTFKMMRSALEGS